MRRFAVIVGTRGRGSNLLALSASFPHQVALVVAPDPSAPAIGAAISRGLAVAVIPFNDCFGKHLRTALALANADLVCLAGFTRLLPADLVTNMTVLNIHPSLLPKYGGKGMFGKHVHEAVLRSGETESGCTVHRVTEIYDEGEIILQRRCPVLPEDTAETLAARVLAEEHRAYPEAVRIVLSTSR